MNWVAVESSSGGCVCGGGGFFSREFLDCGAVGGVSVLLLCNTADSRDWCYRKLEEEVTFWIWDLPVLFWEVVCRS